MTIKKIGLFGNFGIGNLGNDGSLEAILLYLKQSHPNTKLVCICANPDVVHTQFGIPTRRIFVPRLSSDGPFTKLRRRIMDHVSMFKSLNGLEVVLIPGTGILDDFGERPVGMPYMLFVISLFAKIRRIKVAFVSSGAGPIVHPLSRWFMKMAARMATYRSFRDEISKDYMGSIGVNVARDPVYPDLAFGLSDPELIEPRSQKQLTIGLGVMAYYGWSAGDETVYATYISKISTFAIWLLNSGYRIRLLVGEPTDLCAVDDLQKAVSKQIGSLPEGTLVTEEQHSLHDIMAQIASVDAVVATRFHNVLCALKVGKPTISLGYAEKNDVMMVAMGLGAFCQHVERMDVDKLKAQFNELIAQRDTYRNIVIKNINKMRQELLRQEQFLTGNLF